MFNLLGFGRFRGISEPNLVIPIFKSNLTNYAYVHELDQSFLIKRFKIIHTKYFDFVPLSMDISLIDGMPGLIGFEYAEDKLFMGNIHELKEWYRQHSQTLNVRSIIRPIVTDMCSENQLERFDAWRRYLNFKFRKYEYLKEAINAKYAEVQNYNLLWREISERPPTKLDEDALFVKNLKIMTKNEISFWLSNSENHLNTNWRIVWEYADRNLLQTDESMDIVEQYLTHVLVEDELLLVGDVAYFLKRAFEMLKLRQNNEFFLSLDDFMSKGTVLFKRSRIGPDQLIEHIDFLKKSKDVDNYIAPLLFNMLSNAVSMLQDNGNYGQVLVIDYENLRIVLSCIRDNLPHFGRFDTEEIIILVNLYGAMLYYDGRVANHKCLKILNEILKTCGLSTKIVRTYWERNSDGDLQDLLDRVKIEAWKLGDR